MEPSARQTTHNRTSSNHPSDQQLQRFGMGRCSEAEEEQIEQHVLECDACCQKLSMLPDDTLMDQLASHSTPSLPIGGDQTLGGDHLFDASAVGHIAPTGPSPFELALQNHPKYEIIRRIGVGGMGVVYQASHRVMQRTVALKVISPEFLTARHARQRFAREVQIAAQLQHPNVVAAFDADEVDGHLFLVTEYVDGNSVGDRLKQSTLSIDTAIKMAIQAAAGLQHAHHHGLVHRDVKPQNLLFSKTEKVVKVADFGLAKHHQPESRPAHDLTSIGMVVGTVDYLSPEQARNDKVDLRSDIYSLGCTLYHMIAGRPPFASGSRLDRVAQHLRDEAIGLNEIRNDVSPELAGCVARMMAKDPADRFQSMGEVITALEIILPGETANGTSVAPAQVLPNIVKTKGAIGNDTSAGSNRRRVVQLFGGAVAVAGLGGLGLLILPPTAPTAPAKILVVAPPQPLERDLKNLQMAIEQRGISNQLTAASVWESIPGWQGDYVPIQQVATGRYDALIFLGPRTNQDSELTTNAQAKQHVQRVVQAMQAAGKPVASLGSGIWPLTRFGLIRGKRVAGCIHTSADFKSSSGAQWLENQDLVVDGNLITSTNETDASEFIQTLLEQIR